MLEFFFIRKRLKLRIYITLQEEVIDNQEPEGGADEGDKVRKRKNVH